MNVLESVPNMPFRTSDVLFIRNTFITLSIVMLHYISLEFESISFFFFFRDLGSPIIQTRYLISTRITINDTCVRMWGVK